MLRVWPPAPSPCPLTIHPGAVALAVFYIRDVDQELPVVPEDEQGQGALCPLDELLGVSQGHVLAGHPIDLEGAEPEASGHLLLGTPPPGKPCLNGMLRLVPPPSLPSPSSPAPAPGASVILGCVPIPGCLPVGPHPAQRKQISEAN